MIDPAVRPRWSVVMSRQLAAFITGLGVYALGISLEWPDLGATLAAVAAVMFWVRPISLARRVLAGALYSPGKSEPRDRADARKPQYAG